MRRPLLLAAIAAIAVPPMIAATTVTPATQPASAPATTTSKPAAVAQDGPGLYRASAGPGGKYTATFRAKSREDAISIALKTVGEKAIDSDENVNITELKVVRLGP